MGRFSILNEEDRCKSLRRQRANSRTVSRMPFHKRKSYSENSAETLDGPSYEWRSSRALSGILLRGKKSVKLTLYNLICILASHWKYLHTGVMGI